MSTVQSQLEKKFEIYVKEHPGELLQHINSAWKERRLCDFLIKVGSKEIPVHKIILSEGSDYFKAMFSHKMKEVESGVAVMEGVDPECMLICIEYIYTGKVSVPESKVQPLLQVASMLQLTRLCEEIGAFLETNLDPDSFFLTRKIANTFNVQGLKDHCEKYALDNFAAIATNDQFKDLDKEFVKVLIQTTESKVPEAFRCKALLIWGNSDLENRKNAFEEIFLKLDLKKIDADHLRYLEEQEPLVFKSLPCMRKLFRSLGDAHGAVAKEIKMKDTPFNESFRNVIAIFNRDTKCIEAFDPVKKTFTRVHALDDIMSRAQFTAAVMGNEIYLLLSDGTNYKLSYKNTTAGWISLPSRTVTTGRTHPVACNENLFAFDESNHVEKFAITTTTWSRGRNRIIPGHECDFVEAEGLIYCVGIYAARPLTNMIRFNPDRNEWFHMPPMPTARCGVAAASLSGKIYVMGGFGGDRYPVNIECFDIHAKKWTTLAQLGKIHYLFKACVVGNKIYAVGGTRSQNSTEEYDPASNTCKITDMMTGKNIHDRATLTLV